MNHQHFHERLMWARVTITPAQPGPFSSTCPSPHPPSTHEQLGQLSDHSRAGLARDRDRPAEMTGPVGTQRLTLLCCCGQHRLIQAPSRQITEGACSPKPVLQSLPAPPPVFHAAKRPGLNQTVPPPCCMAKLFHLSELQIPQT